MSDLPDPSEAVPAPVEDEAPKFKPGGPLAHLATGGGGDQPASQTDPPPVVNPEPMSVVYEAPPEPKSVGHWTDRQRDQLRRMFTRVLSGPDPVDALLRIFEEGVANGRPDPYPPGGGLGAEADPAGAAAVTPCGTCGAAVVDMAKHMEFAHGA